MDDLIFSIILYVIMAMGILSVAWMRSGMKGITDDLLKRLFRRLVALTMIAIVFAAWILISEISVGSQTVHRFVISISLVGMFALISGAALSVKKIGDTYGFNVPEKK